MLELLPSIPMPLRLYTCPVPQVLRDCGEFLLEHRLQLAVGGAVGFFLLWKLSPRRPPGIPPGPGFALPLLGHLHLVGRDPRAKFTKWRRQYGDIFSLYMGNRLVIVFNGYSVIKEAFVKFADHFSERPHLLSTDRLAANQGIMLASGPGWKEQRKVSLEIFRELRIGANEVTEDDILNELAQFVHRIEGFQGSPTDLHKLIVVSVCNNISSIVIGKRYQYDDPLFSRYLEAVEDNFERLGGAAVVNLFPFLERIPGDLFGIKRIVANMKVIEEEFLQPEVTRHIYTTNPNQPRDFMLCYLDRMIWNERWYLESTLCESQLVRTAGDLIIAGTETTSAVISWALLLLLHYPHVQTKCFEEIQRVIGVNTMPNVTHRDRMVYLEATVWEVLRFASVGAFAVQHTTPSDVTFRGYVVPEGAVIIPFMTTALRDEVAWGEPLRFLPERFIDADGELTHPPDFVPFGVGRRRCMGEMLAKMELFLYLSTLIQRFEFLPPSLQTLPPLEGVLGAIHVPKRYQIRALLRKK